MEAPSTTESPTESVQTADPLLGTRLGGAYLVTRVIAVGGMGVVYEAEHLRLRRAVALKVMRADPRAQGSSFARFEQEAEIIAELRHPHIVQVLDVGTTHAGDPYLVMELLVGETLADRLDRVRRVTVAEAVRIAADLASALAAAHAHGVVHRDLKPDNVYLERVEGSPDFVKLLDFGVSKRMTTPRKLTLANAFVGTPSYMAPEQVTARRSVDARADQFALAAITYEMLSGRETFPAASLAVTIDAVLNSTPTPISELAPWVSAEIQGVVERGLSKAPDDRYRSISQFAWALANAADAGKARWPGKATEPELTTAPGVTTADRGDHETEGAEPESSFDPRADARRLANSVRGHFRAREIDAAVRDAERLLELLVFGTDAAVLDEVAPALPLLDNVFATRVGALEQVLRQGPRARDVRRLNLSPRAVALAGRFEESSTVADVIARSGMPRRDTIRLLAGLLRREVLESG